MASDVMFSCVFLLGFGLQFTTGCEVYLPHISCSPGESVLLNCSDINSHHTDVQWWIADPQTHTPQYSVFPLDTDNGQRYKDRVQLHGNLSLSITRLTVDDAGTYCCETKETNKKCLVHLTVEGCSVSGNEGSEEISRYPGESVFLSCLVKCSTRFNPDSDFRWKLPHHREINQDINPDELHRLYQGRFHMFNIRSGNLSLMISNVTEEDEGLYFCWINENQHKSFRLTVNGCVLSEHHVTEGSTGSSVILPCSCEDPKTRPEHFEWKRAADNETLVSDAEEINGRFQMIRDSPHHLFLQISNLTETDGGEYVCSVDGKRPRRVSLTVTDTADIISLSYQYYLIFLVLLISLMLVVVCIFWRFIRAKKVSRGSREIQRANDEDEVAYSTVMQIKGRKPAENQQQDDVTYSSVTHIKGKKRPPKKQEEVVYSTMADMSRSTQEDITYSSVVHIRS